LNGGKKKKQTNRTPRASSSNKTQKIPDQKLIPKIFHAEFPSLKNFQKGLNDIT